MYTTAWFYARHPVFTVDEFIADNPETKRESKYSLLAHKQRSGRLLHIRRGLYAVIPDGTDLNSFMVDPYLIAAKATSDAIIAYHAALSFHGYAYSISNTFTYLTTQSESTKFIFQGSEFIGIKQPKALMKRGKEAAYVDIVERDGMKINVTSLERTLVDCFDRLDVCGGIEEVWRSFETISYLHINRVLSYVAMLDNSITAAKVGFFLEMNKEHFNVSKKDLEFLRDRRPLHNSYMFRSQRTGKLVRNWNLIVPAKVLERSWEEPR
jgi:predicted transcriptional regulator of viral defense system